MRKRIGQTRRGMPASQRGPRSIVAKTFPAPIGGWVTADSLIASRPNSALILDNIFPMLRSVRPRGGSTVWCTLPDAAESMMTYNVRGDRAFFAATETTVYNITVPNAPVAQVTDQTSGYYSYVNFATSGGYFLLAVNGTDPLRLYDGDTWSAITDVSTPLAIAGVETNRLSHVSVYRNRLFFVEGGTLNIWYLDINSIAGTASTFNLAGVFKEGGSILATANWSMDAGDGLDDKLVVISTEGEIAVYQGADPSDGDNWTIVGQYEMSSPMGARAMMRAGGDLLIAAREGLIPMSAVTNKDPAALSLSAISANIEPDWIREATDRQALPWEIAKWTKNSQAIISLPTTSEEVTDQFCFVVNLKTGAWARYTGWDTRCLELYDDWVYFGTRHGRIMRGELGGSDDGNPFYMVAAGNWDSLGEFGTLKTVHQARGTFLTPVEIIPQLSVSTDYIVNLPVKPNAPILTETPSLWDVGKWDEAKWDAGTQKFTFTTPWESIGRTGYSFAWQWQQSSGAPQQAEVELVEITITVEQTSVTAGLVI